MNAKMLKFIRNNLYQYDGIWLVKTGTIHPLKSILICQLLNNRNLYRSNLTDAKNNLYN